MVVKGPLPVVAFNPFPKRLVALYDVEHIPQHLQHGAVRLCANRSRPRIEAHASHLAKEITWLQLSNGIIEGQIDRSINGYKGAFTLCIAGILRLAGDG